MKRLLFFVVLLLVPCFLFAADQTRLPTGIGSADAWTLGAPNTGEQKYEDVDDPIGTPDDDATYIQNADTAASQHFTFAAPTVPAGATNIAVNVIARCKRTEAGLAGFYHRLRVGGTNYTAGTVGTVAITWTTYDGGAVTINPKSTVAWTVDDINGVGANALEQFGLLGSGLVSGETVMCTQVYLLITWTTGCAHPGSLMLMGVGC